MANQSHAGETGGLTERDRFWLRHHEACQTSGQLGKVYARAHRLSVDAFYQSAKRLRGVGALALAGKRRANRGPARGVGVRFAKVGMLRVPVDPVPARYRIRLPSGIQIEWEGRAEGSELATVLRAVGTDR